MFYDMIFGVSDESSNELNALEIKVIDGVEEILENPIQISSYIPSLPKIVTELIGLIGSDNHDFSKIGEVISRDVELTIEVVKMANSPFYSTSREPIKSLEQAVRSLGIKRIAAIATTALTENLLRVSAIYFKWFGEIIWTHSLECAMGCQYMRRNDRPFTGYLLGLVHDVGKIVIFRCLVDAFDQTGTTEVPRSKLFRQIMTEHSLWISILIAREWSLPNDIIAALEQQETGQKEDLGQALYLVNICSEVHLLVQSGAMGKEDGFELLERRGLSNELAQELFANMELLSS